MPRPALWEERQRTIVKYRCRVGHAYSPLAMAQEKTLWSTLVALEEAAEIAGHIGARTDVDKPYIARRGSPDIAA